MRNGLVALLIGITIFSCDDKPYDYAAAKRADEEALKTFLESNEYQITEDNYVDGIYFLEQVAGDPNGLKPSFGRNVKINYKGTFLDGEEFDSGDLEYPFQTQSVIAGMDIGVGKLTKGGKAILVIPYVLAYGMYGSGSIPPCTSLVFEIELLMVQ